MTGKAFGIQLIRFLKVRSVEIRRHLVAKALDPVARAVHGRIHRYNERATTKLFSFLQHAENELTAFLAQVVKLKPERRLGIGCDVFQPSRGKTADDKGRAG